RVLLLAFVLVLAPGDVAAEPDRIPRLAGLLQQSAELLVVEERLRLLALDHVGQLRPGERGVHVEGTGAELGDRERRLDEATVVAAQDRDPAPPGDATGRKAGSDCVRARLHLGEGEGPEL